MVVRYNPISAEVDTPNFNILGAFAQGQAMRQNALQNILSTWANADPRAAAALAVAWSVGRPLVLFGGAVAIAIAHQARRQIETRLMIIGVGGDL